MSRILVVYESKYGNTKRAAETIAEGMRRVEGTEIALSEARDVDFSAIPGYDAVVIGGPTHFGGPTRGIKKFINRLGSIPSEGTQFAVFSTYLEGDVDKATRKMEQSVGEKAPGMRMAAQGLSIRVDGIKGPIAEGELSQCEEFGVRIASHLMPRT